MCLRFFSHKFKEIITKSSFHHIVEVKQQEIEDIPTEVLQEEQPSKTVTTPRKPPLQAMDLPRLNAGTSWHGSINVNGTETVITLQIGIRRGRNITGSMNYENAKTKVQGNVSGNQIEFVETEVIKGSSRVPVVYKGESGVCDDKKCFE